MLKFCKIANEWLHKHCALDIYAFFMQKSITFESIFVIYTILSNRLLSCSAKYMGTNCPKIATKQKRDAQHVRTPFYFFPF